MRERERKKKREGKGRDGTGWAREINGRKEGRIWVDQVEQSRAGQGREDRGGQGG
jgi:hypothetical protein